MEVEVRRVQSAGYVTVTVSLPRNWVRETGIKPGDKVSIVTEDDGSLRLSPGLLERKKEVFNCVVDADKSPDPDLLAKVVAGLYITGQERITVKSRRPLSEEQARRLRGVAGRMIGVGVVEETPASFSLQSFLDPTKYPVHQLIRRIYSITSAMLNGVIRALSEGEKVYAEQAAKMEDEADKIYWLVARQLLLATKDRGIAGKIGIDSPLHVLGNRVVAKVLEEIGDRLQAVAFGTIEVLRTSGSDKGSLSEVAAFAQRVRALYDRTIAAFSTLNIGVASEVIRDALGFESEEAELTRRALTGAHARICDACLSGAKKGPPKDLIAVEVASAADLRGLIWNLIQIARHCKTIAEITINRGLESPTGIYSLERLDDA
ncbi:MAG: phosphate uptake regulator PhoU [Thaumarchaeota archaeon]|nr:phosphate uptake regulator PhoU [Nitrososphaerota archaeon]